MKCYLAARQNTSKDGRKYLTVTVQEYRDATRKNADEESDFLCD
jgi:hypothetical protein